MDVESTNDTSVCHASPDLPAVGAAEQEHLSPFSSYFVF